MTKDEAERLAKLEIKVEQLQDTIDKIETFMEKMDSRWEEQDRSTIAGFNTINNHLSELKRKFDLWGKAGKWCAGLVASAIVAVVGAWVAGLLGK